MSSPDSTTCSLPNTDQERLARILDDYLVAIERGVPVTPEELLDKYPEDAEQLRGYLSGLQLFHAAAAPQINTSIINGPLPQPSQTIGDYKLVKEIGRGGMGVVYEAWQQSLRRRVALKILPFSVASDAKHLSRFKNEAQAAAQVQHPNIVPVYTIGEDQGVHFYVMQLIEGQSLTSLLEGLRSSGHRQGGTTAANYADQTIAPPQQHELQRTDISNDHSDATPAIVPMRAAETADHIRVVARLGMQAAGALHAAHEYGVVHRDVKPSNLLLDDQGKLWVTDFGLARCREAQGLTQTGDILGTMRYMSPEQSHGRNALIDQRTDIYSLGVTMYELATLHHPGDGVSDLQLYFDRQRQAPKPLRQWNRHIPADFQTIVLKCLSEFPQDRYSTANELAEDLERFLEGRPIAASPPSLLSRTVKWAKRRRGVAAAAAIAVFLAVGGTIAATMIVQHANYVANQQSMERTKRFAGETMEAFNPAKWADQLAAIPGAEGVRHEMLQAGIEFYQRNDNLSDDPALATNWAWAQVQLGLLNEKLNNKKDAVQAVSKAVQVWEERAAREPSNLENTRQLALARHVLALQYLQDGQTRESFNLLTKVRDSQNRLLKADPQSRDFAADLVATQKNLGLTQKQLGDQSAAIKDFSEAIRIALRIVKDSDPNEDVLRNLATSYNNLGMLQDAWEPVRAAEAYRSAIAIERKLVKAHPVNRGFQDDLARVYNNFGFLWSRSKNWANAEVCYNDAIQLQQNLVKSSPATGVYRQELAISYNNIGMAQSGDGKFAEAEASFRRSLDLQQALIAAQPNDSEILSNQGGVWGNLGILYDRQRRYDDGEKAYHTAIISQRKALEAAPNNDHYRTLLSGHYLNLVRNLNNQSKFEAAIQAAVARKKLWPGNPDRLYSVAQQLAGTYSLMQSTSASPQSQSECLTGAIDSLREAIAAGLPAERLNDQSLASLVKNEEFRKLMDRSTTVSRTN